MLKRRITVGEEGYMAFPYIQSGSKNTRRKKNGGLIKLLQKQKKHTWKRTDFQQGAKLFHVPEQISIIMIAKIVICGRIIHLLVFIVYSKRVQNVLFFWGNGDNLPPFSV